MDKSLEKELGAPAAFAERNFSCETDLAAGLCGRHPARLIRLERSPQNAVQPMPDQFRRAAMFASVVHDQTGELMLLERRRMLE